MGQRSPICFSAETLIFTGGVGGTIPVASSGADVPRVTRSAGKMRLRFSVDVLNNVVGDGTTAHAIGIVGRTSGAATWELLGFAGLGLGGALPQLPLRTDRDFSMMIDAVDGYDQIGVCGYAAAEGYGAGNTLTVRASWVLDDGSATP